MHISSCKEDFFHTIHFEVKNALNMSISKLKMRRIMFVEEKENKIVEDKESFN